MPDIRILTEGDSSVLSGDQPEDHCHCTAYERTAYRGSCRYDPCVLFFAG